MTDEMQAIDSAPEGPVAADRTAVGGLSAEHAAVDRSVVGGVRASDVRLERSVVGGVAAGEVTIHQGVAQGVVAGNVTLDRAAARSVVAGSVHMAPGSGALLVVAGRVDGEPRLVLDRRAGLILALGLLVIAALVQGRRASAR